MREFKKIFYIIIFCVVLSCNNDSSSNKSFTSPDCALHESLLVEPCTVKNSMGDIKQIFRFDQGDSAFKKITVLDTGFIRREAELYQQTDGEFIQFGYERFDSLGRKVYSSIRVIKELEFKALDLSMDSMTIMVRPKNPSLQYSRISVNVNNDSIAQHFFGDGTEVKFKPNGLTYGENVIYGTFIEFDLITHDGRDSVAFEFGEATPFKYQFEID